MANKTHFSVDERDIFIRGTLLYLTVLKEEDIHNSGWYGWFNNETTTEYMQQHVFPNTKEQQLNFYRSAIANSATKIQLGILPKRAESIIGVVSLSNIDLINRKAEFAIMIGESKVQGKGYGTEAAKLILKHGFERLGLHKIYLGVHGEHHAAIKSYQKSGFVVDGVLRDDIFLKGKFYHTVMMSITDQEWFAAKQSEEQV